MRIQIKFDNLSN